MHDGGLVPNSLGQITLSEFLGTSVPSVCYAGPRYQVSF